MISSDSQHKESKDKSKTPKHLVDAELEEQDSSFEDEAQASQMWYFYFCIIGLLVASISTALLFFLQDNCKNSPAVLVLGIFGFGMGTGLAFLAKYHRSLFESPNRLIILGVFSALVVLVQVLVLVKLIFFTEKPFVDKKASMGPFLGMEEESVTIDPRKLYTSTIDFAKLKAPKGTHLKGTKDEVDSLKFSFLISRQTFESIDALYQLAVNVDTGKINVNAFGARLQALLKDRKVKSIKSPAHLFSLINLTRHPRVSAEGVFGWGRFWTPEEYRILAETVVLVHTRALDNAAYSNPLVHQHPFPVSLAFVSGLILSERFLDYKIVCNDAKPPMLFPEKYYHAYKQRLLPALIAFSRQAQRMGTRILVTVPAIGCGSFSHAFPQPMMYKIFLWTLQSLIKENGPALFGIDVWVSFYYRKAVLSNLVKKFKCTEEKLIIKSGNYTPAYSLVNEFDESKIIPSTEGACDESKPRIFVESWREGSPVGLQQLDTLEKYQKAINAYPYKAAITHLAQYGHLCSIVAWDPFSWPGNDWLENSRNTDDGVKGAATEALAVLTGEQHKGIYKSVFPPGFYPQGYADWETVIGANNYFIDSRGRTFIVEAKGGEGAEPASSTRLDFEWQL